MISILFSNKITCSKSKASLNQQKVSINYLENIENNKKTLISIEYNKENKNSVMSENCTIDIIENIIKLEETISSNNIDFK